MANDINYQERVTLFLPGQAAVELPLAEAICRIMIAREIRPLTGAIVGGKNSEKTYTNPEIETIYGRPDFPRTPQ